MTHNFRETIFAKKHYLFCATFTIFSELFIFSRNNSTRNRSQRAERERAWLSLCFCCCLLCYRRRRQTRTHKHTRRRRRRFPTQLSPAELSKNFRFRETHALPFSLALTRFPARCFPFHSLMLVLLLLLLLLLLFSGIFFRSSRSIFSSGGRFFFSFFDGFLLNLIFFSSVYATTGT